MGLLEWLADTFDGRGRAACGGALPVYGVDINPLAPELRQAGAVAQRVLAWNQSCFSPWIPSRCGSGFRLAELRTTGALAAAGSARVRTLFPVG